MLTLEKCLVAGSDSFNSKGKDYRSVVLSVNSQVIKLDCTEEVFNAIPSMIGKVGTFHLGIAFRNFSGRTSITVSSITSAK